MWYRFTCWLDYHWGMMHARMSQRDGPTSPHRHPVMFYVGTVPLSTWLRNPRTGVESVRRNAAAWRDQHFCLGCRRWRTTRRTRE